MAEAQEQPADPAPPAHQQAAINPKVLDHYTGYYEADPRFLRDTIFTVARTKDQLFVQMMGQQTFPVFPEGGGKFFYKVADAEVSFLPASKGPAAQLILHQNGKDLPAQRVDRAEAERVTQAFFARVKDERRPRKAIRIDAHLLDGYAGQYKLSPAVTLTVTRQDSHLFAQLTGQDSYEIFPDAKDDFFYKVVPAQITFIMDDKGYATRAILHQNGREVAADRVP